MLGLMKEDPGHGVHWKSPNFHFDMYFQLCSDRDNKKNLTEALTLNKKVLATVVL